MTAGDQTRTVTPEKTANRQTHHQAGTGAITLPHADDYDFKITGIRKGPAILNLRKIVLAP